MLHRYAVGELYNPRRAHWPEAAHYLLRGGVHELVLFWGGLDSATVAAVRSGRIFASALEIKSVLLFLYKIEGAAGWSDSPFSWHRLPAEERVLPAQEQETSALLHVTLVEAETGVVRVLRVVSLTPELTTFLHAAIARQARLPSEPASYEQDLREATQHSCEDLARRSGALAAELSERPS